MTDRLQPTKIDQFLKVLKWRDDILLDIRPDMESIMPMAFAAIDEALEDNEPWSTHPWQRGNL